MSRLSNTFSFFPSAALFWCLALPTPASSGHAITIFHVSCHASPNVSLNPSAVSDIDAPGRVCSEDKHRPSAPLTNEAHLSLQLSVDPLHYSVAWMCNVKHFFFFTDDPQLPAAVCRPALSGGWRERLQGQHEPR